MTARWPEPSSLCEDDHAGTGHFEQWRLRDVREVILHVITETATHAGHRDAARELLDGRTWMGPEETRVARD